MQHTSKISLNQERYLVAEEFTHTNFTLAASYRIKGPLDTQKLISCLQRVVDSNEALRIKFFKDANGNITQELFANNPIVCDYQTLDNPTDAQIKAVISQYFYTKNEIFGVFLTKCQLIKLNETVHILTIASHHSLMDGLSFAVMLMQLAKAWNQNKTQLGSHGQYLQILAESGLLTLSNDKLFELSAFWKQYLENPNPAQIPYDLKSTKPQSDEKARATRLIHQHNIDQIDQFTKANDCTKFHLFYLAFNLLIGKQSDGHDVITSFESHGRQDLNNASRALGLFSTALVLRTKLDDSITMRQLLSSIKRDAEQCIAHQHYPYDRIIKDANINPRYSFNWFPKYTPPKLNGLEISQESYLNWQSSFDLNLHCYTQDEGVSLELFYNPDIFDASRVEVFLEQLEHIVQQIVADVSRDVSSIRLYTSKTDDILPDVKDTFSAKIQQRIDEDFYHQAKQHAQNIALSFFDQHWTYAETVAISTKLAHLLHSKGVRAGNKVAIMGLRCPSLIMAMLATLRCGASFAILNAAYPAGVLRKYWDTLRPDFLITCDQLASINDVDNFSFIDRPYLEIGQTLSIDDALFSSLEQVHPTFEQANPNSIAYYLFTSGTTDAPKCIATSHNPLVHFVRWQINQFHIQPNDRFTLLSGISHDPVLRDIFTALSAGGTILIPTEQLLFNPDLLYPWLLNKKPTICHTTPAMTKLMHSGYHGSEKIESLRAIFSGGDRLEGHHVNDMMTIAPNAKLINFYGATETPQAMAYYEVPNASLSEIIPIGKPIADTQILVLRNSMVRGDLYEVGQIAVRSKYLSEGYVASNTAEPLSNTSFLRDPYSDDPDINIYLTGDNGFYRADGNVVFLGRSDDEIKVRGFRINLNVINHNLKTIPAITDAFSFVVDDLFDNTDKKRLVTYIVKAKNSTLNAQEVRRILSSKLPSYMLPTQYVFVSELPLLPNGKIDRKKIVASYHENEAKQSEKPIGGRNEVENNLIYAWAKILNINPRKVSAKDSFTSLDGDSLSFIQASMVLEKEIGKIPDEWQSMSIEQLAQIRYQTQNKLDMHTEVLFRALAITLVVIGHFWIVETNQHIEELFVNATSALFLIAGFTFANFPMKSIQYKHDITPIIKTIIRIAVPTFLVTLVHVVYRSDYSVSKLLFFDNFHWTHSPYWFIEILLQTLALLAIIFSFRKIREKAINQPYQFGLIMLAITVFIGIITPLVWAPKDLNLLQLPHLKSWLFFFGWCVFYINSQRQKIFMSMLGILLPVIVLGQISLLTSACTLLLIYLPKVEIVKNKCTELLHVVIYAVASASLYIYITHIQFRSLLHAIGINQSVVIDILVGISGGVLVHYIWHSLIAATARKVVAISKTKALCILNKIKPGLVK